MSLGLWSLAPPSWPLGPALPVRRELGELEPELTLGKRRGGYKVGEAGRTGLAANLCAPVYVRLHELSVHPSLCVCFVPCASAGVCVCTHVNVHTCLHPCVCVHAPSRVAYVEMSLHLPGKAGSTGQASPRPCHRELTASGHPLAARRFPKTRGWQ